MTQETDETNRFKVKTWRGFGIAILKVKQIHYKRIEVFTIRFLTIGSFYYRNGSQYTIPVGPKCFGC